MERCLQRRKTGAGSSIGYLDSPPPSSRSIRTPVQTGRAFLPRKVAKSIQPCQFTSQLYREGSHYTPSIRQCGMVCKRSSFVFILQQRGRPRRAQCRPQGSFPPQLARSHLSHPVECAGHNAALEWPFSEYLGSPGTPHPSKCSMFINHHIIDDI
jgi:hypothetical protein